MRILELGLVLVASSSLVEWSLCQIGVLGERYRYELLFQAHVFCPGLIPDQRILDSIRPSLLVLRQVSSAGPEDSGLGFAPCRRSTESFDKWLPYRLFPSLGNLDMLGGMGEGQ